jgi:predicted secreted protein
MASTGKNNGTLLALYVGGTKIAHLTSSEVSFEHSTRDATTKDSAGYKEVLEGLRSGSFSGEGYFAEDAAYGYNDLFAAYTGRTQLTVRYSSEVAGDEYYEGTCYLTSLSRSSGVEETETFSASFEMTGAPTNDVVS